MAKIIIESDVKKGERILSNYGYSKKDNLFTHPSGSQIKINANSKYPFSIKFKDTDTWDDEFSLDGLMSQLGDMHE